MFIYISRKQGNRKSHLNKNFLDISEQVAHAKIINSSNKAKIRNLGKYTL
jgi:hypothetical protein